MSTTIDTAVDAAELTIDLPRRIDRVLGEVERGNLKVWTDVEDLEPMIKRLQTRSPVRMPRYLPQHASSA